VVAGQTEYKIEGQKGLPFAVTAQVRMTRPHKAALMAVRSLNIEVPANGIALPEPNPLAHLVFEVMKAGAGSAPASITHGAVGIPKGDAKNRVVDYLKSQNVPNARDVARDLWVEHCTDAPEVPADDLAKVLDAAAEWVENNRPSNGSDESTTATSGEGPAASGSSPEPLPLPPENEAVNAAVRARGGKL
jgi:hypothetical protein